MDITSGDFNYLLSLVTQHEQALLEDGECPGLRKAQLEDAVLGARHMDGGPCTVRAVELIKTWAAAVAVGVAAGGVAEDDFADGGVSFIGFDSRNTTKGGALPLGGAMIPAIGRVHRCSVLSCCCVLSPHAVFFGWKSIFCAHPQISSLPL